MKINVATHNEHKLREIAELLPGFEIAADDPGAEETAPDFAGNALIKVRAIAARHPGEWSMADDSGLEVRALGGAPGVRSARYAGEPCSTPANNALLLKNMEGVEDRSARFTCAVALVDPEGREHVVVGHCPGRIAQSPSGKAGFGYDPLFIPEGRDKSFAELGEDEKNRLSHRGRALAKALQLLRRRQAQPSCATAVLSAVCIAACGVAMSVDAWAGSLAELADTRFGTARSHGSNVLGPSLPHGSAHPSPDSLWPTPHPRPKGARHGFGPPTSGWWPGDKVVGFSQLHAQGTGGTPSYGIFRYVFEPDDMEILESRPYRLKTRMKKSGMLVDVSATAHGAIYHVRKADGTPLSLPLDRRCKIAASNCVNKSGEFTGNWNPAPYRCWAHSEVDAATGLHRIAVSFHSEARAREHFARELAGRGLDEIADAAKKKWEEALSCIDIEGVDDAERRKFYSLLMETFIQPRDRSADGLGWDDHYTLWDTWRTYWPLKSIIAPHTLAANVNSFADRFEATGECTSCRTSGKEFKIGAGGDEADCVVADAWAKNIPGIDWKRVAKLLRSRWNGRTEGYRVKGYVPTGERGGYCWRFKSGSATMNFAYEDWCCAEVLDGLGEKALAAKFRVRSGNWKNVWDGAAIDEKSGFRGFVRGRNADGSFSRTDPRGGFNTDFYEANCWEYSFFVPHDVQSMIARCGGKDGFERRLTYALENGLVDFSNEPSFHLPWLYAYVGRGDLAAKWADRAAALFKGEDLPGDNDSGAMCSLWIFMRLGFFPVAGQDLYIMHGSAYPKIAVRPPGGKTFTIRAICCAPGRRVKSVTLNGRPHDPLFLRHSEIAAGGELTFIYDK